MRKRLGGGLQYIVYQISDTRVVKVPASLFHKIKLCIFMGYAWMDILSDIKDVDRLALESITELKARGTALPGELLGNPTFGVDIGYEQDFMTPIGDYLKTHTLEQNKKIFDLYIQNTLELWEHGIADVVFNFTINNGVTKDGRVVLTDLGELTFSKKVIAELIEEKMWLGQRSFKRLKKSDPTLYSYVESEMNSKITLSALDMHWDRLKG